MKVDYMLLNDIRENISNKKSEIGGVFSQTNGKIVFSLIENRSEAIKVYKIDFNISMSDKSIHGIWHTHSKNIFPSIKDIQSMNKINDLLSKKLSLIIISKYVLCKVKFINIWNFTVPVILFHLNDRHF